MISTYFDHISYQDIIIHVDITKCCQGIGFKLNPLECIMTWANSFWTEAFPMPRLSKPINMVHWNPDNVWNNFLLKTSVRTGAGSLKKQWKQDFTVKTAAAMVSQAIYAFWGHLINYTTNTICAIWYHNNLSFHQLSLMNSIVYTSNVSCYRQKQCTMCQIQLDDL